MCNSSRSLNPSDMKVRKTGYPTCTESYWFECFIYWWKVVRQLAIVCPTILDNLISNAWSVHFPSMKVRSSFLRFFLSTERCFEYWLASRMVFYKRYNANSFTFTILCMAGLDDIEVRMRGMVALDILSACSCFSYLRTSRFVIFSKYLCRSWLP